MRHAVFARFLPVLLLAGLFACASATPDDALEEEGSSAALSGAPSWGTSSTLATGANALQFSLAAGEGAKLVVSGGSVSDGTLTYALGGGAAKAVVKQARQVLWLHNTSAAPRSYALTLTVGSAGAQLLARKVDVDGAASAGSGEREAACIDGKACSATLWCVKNDEATRQTVTGSCRAATGDVSLDASRLGTCESECPPGMTRQR